MVQHAYEKYADNRAAKRLYPRSDAEGISLRFTSGMLLALDEWAVPLGFASRSAAVKWLVEQAIAGKIKGPRK